MSPFFRVAAFAANLAAASVLPVGLGHSSAFAQGLQSGGAGSTAGVSSSGLDEADTEFLHSAAAEAVFEEALGRLAVARAVGPALRRYAYRLVAGRSRVLAGLRDLAARSAIVLPAHPDPAQQASLRRFGSLSGDAFDEAFLDHEVAHGRDIIGNYRLATKAAHSPALRSFAEESLATLEAQLAMVGTMNRVE